MTFRNISDNEAERGENFFWLSCDSLTVLQRAGGMVSDDEAWRVLSGFERQAREIFGNVLGKTRDTGSTLRIDRIFAHHEPVILDRGAATRGRDQDGVEVRQDGPGVDIGARLRQRLVLAAHVMDQRAAAA